MPDILQFWTVQATPHGFRSLPAALVYSTNGGQDPENVANDIPAGFENVSGSLAWRQYDRLIIGDLIYVYQQATIWQLFDGSNWSAAHAIVGQDTSVDSGVHTGLYRVTTNDREFICGLFAQPAGSGIGWVKQDVATGVWTSAIVAGTQAQGGTMGKCVVFQGRLYHPSGGSKLQWFDPITEEVGEEPYSAIASGGVYAKLSVVCDRLFLFTDTGPPQLLEFAFGALFSHGTLAAESIHGNQASGSDSIALTGLPAINTDILFIWNCQVGGSGFRAHEIKCNPALGRGSAVTITENTIVIPDGTGPSLDFNGFGPNLSYANGPAVVGNDTWLFTDGGWQLEQGPLFSGVPLAFVMLKINFGSYVTFLDSPLPQLPSTSRRIDWNGAAAVANYVHVTGNHSVSLTYSQVASLWGSADRLSLNGVSIDEVTVAPHSDVAVPRGLLVTFKVKSSWQLGDAGSNLYVGFARKLGRPDTRASLSVGDGNAASFVGGVATFNAGANQIEDLPPGGGFPVGRGTIPFTTPIGALTIGEIVEGGTSLARGVLSIENATSGNLYLQGVTGVFVAGETLTGLTSASTRVAAGPLLETRTYQIVWDVDADGIPEREWVSVQFAHFNAEGQFAYVMGGNFQLQIVTALQPGGNPDFAQGPPALLPGNSSATPLTIQGPPVEETTDSSASPVLTQGPAALEPSLTSATPVTLQGPVSTEPTLGSLTPDTTQGPVADTIPDADLEGRLVRPVPGRPNVRGAGVVGVFDNDVDQGQRDALSFLDPATPVLPGQAWEGEPALPTGPVIKLRLDGLVELGRATLDCVNDAVGTRQTLLDVSAAGLDAFLPAGVLPLGSTPGVGVLALRARATLLTGPVILQPTISIGVGGSFDSQSPATQLSLMATDEIEELPLVALRDLLRGGDLLEAELDVQANATAYQIEVILYGFHRVR